MSTLPETVLQFGAGRFLRAFVDRFVHQANETGQEVGKIVVVQSTPGPRANLLNQQPDGFHVVVRGYEKGKLVDRTEKVGSIQRALIASEQWNQVIEVARSTHLKYLVTNATEAGYVLDEGDTLSAAPPKTLPAKITQVLWHRYESNAPGLVLLPCELIENNAEKLKDLVLTQAQQWTLSENFLRWVSEECSWLNNLVDCIVTDGPLDHPMTGSDQLLVCAEPYELWAIQRPAGKELKLFKHSALKIVDDLRPYYLRKVRILNGLHTAMVGKFLPAGFGTVQQVLGDAKASNWVRELLFEEIVPTLSPRLQGVPEFAEATLDRLRNPYQAHQLSDIALNHSDKVRVRLKPTYEEFEKQFGKTPTRLAEAMAEQE